MVKEIKDADAVDAATVCTIEALKEKHETPAASFEGAKAMHGWKPGRQITDAEYVKAVESFLSAPAARR